MLITKDLSLYDQHSVNKNAENKCGNIKQERLRTCSPTITSCSESERSQSPQSSYASFLKNDGSSIVSVFTKDIPFKQNDMDTLRILLREVIYNYLYWYKW